MTEPDGPLGGGGGSDPVSARPVSGASAPSKEDIDRALARQLLRADAIVVNPALTSPEQEAGELRVGDKVWVGTSDNICEVVKSTGGDIYMVRWRSGTYPHHRRELHFVPQSFVKTDCPTCRGDGRLGVRGEPRAVCEVCRGTGEVMVPIK